METNRSSKTLWGAVIILGFIVVVLGALYFGEIQSDRWGSTQEDKVAESQSNQIDVEEAIRLAKLGDAEQQLRLAFLYMKGEGVDKNAVEAVKWACRAAEQGHKDGQSACGIAYLTGLGIPQNEEEAVKWFRKAAMQGSSVAMVNMGKLYLTKGDRWAEVAYPWCSVAAAVDDEDEEAWECRNTAAAKIEEAGLTALVLPNAQERAAELYEEIFGTAQNE